MEIKASRPSVRAAQGLWDGMKSRGPLGLAQVGRMGCDRREAVPRLP